MVHKVFLLTNYNLYESKRHFTYKLAEAFNRKNIETKIFDAKGLPLSHALISSILSFAPDFTCSFNSFAPNPDLTETPFLGDFMQIPHLSLLVDPAPYSLDLIKSPHSILSCVDRFDCEFFKSRGFKNVFFLPHAIEKDLIEEKLVQKKEFDVVLIGSCYDYESLRKSWQKTLSAPFSKLLDTAIEIFFADDQIPLIDALNQAVSLSKIKLNDTDLITLFHNLDFYTRGKDRIDLIRSIKDVPVHVFGSLSEDTADYHLGWNDYVSSQKNVVIHPPVPFPKSFDILKKSKICLNSMPFFRDGSHERIFSGLACGTLPLTTDNQYVREKFVDNEDLLIYRHTQLQAVNERVFEFVQDDTNRERIVESGRKKVLMEHIWDVRVEQIVKEMSPILKRILLT